ncbi:Asp-tRNA(Asn)/Glu-tRNA(Gln) amidotransferase subunit GatC [Patescibacteria group bacterium]|nr:Asp-tRNA(Asn)/Glu-tRNA(Gln) amidotransferase subunit GatC [Patescibacteria group bacterium]
MAVSVDEVKKLAELSRLSLSDQEVETLRGELDSIVNYIEAVASVSLPDAASRVPHTDLINVLREDRVTHESGAHTAEITAQFPDAEDGYLRVKKIIGSP